LLLLRRRGERGRELPAPRWFGVDHRQGRPDHGSARGGDHRAHRPRAGRALPRPRGEVRSAVLSAHRHPGDSGAEGEARKAVTRERQGVDARGRADHGEDHARARQRRPDRRAQGGDGERLVRRAPVGQREHHEDLRGELPRRGASRADPARGAGDRRRGAPIGGDMKATAQLHELGQSLWLDSITREMLDRGTLASYVDELSVTGLTSNPTIFEKAIGSGAYDGEIRQKRAQGKSGEELFFELAQEDLARAAALFRPIHERTHGVDGWVSLEVSPRLAHDAKSTLREAKRLHRQAGGPHLLIKIPGTREGLPAIEEAIFAGVPINVTLLFSREHYVEAAEAFIRGIERRIDAGLDPHVASVASLFVSRWDVAVAKQVPTALHNR